MFTRHTTEFATVTSAQAVKGAMLSLSAETIIETDRGWTAVADMRPSDRFATLDGGFVAPAWLRRSNPCASFHIPAAALGNCSDMVLPADSRVGYTAPLSFTEATTDTLSLPVRAFEGHRGIRKIAAHEAPSVTIGLAEEEMIWAHTGALLHARPMTSPYFHALNFAQARALLALQSTSPSCVAVAA